MLSGVHLNFSSAKVGNILTSSIVFVHLSLSIRYSYIRYIRRTLHAEGSPSAVIRRFSPVNFLTHALFRTFRASSAPCSRVSISRLMSTLNVAL
jgi:hypothetical protein